MTLRCRIAGLALLALLPFSAVLAQGRDVSTVRYVATTYPGGATVSYDGTSFVTAWGAGAVFTARTNPATGTTSRPLPLAGVAEAAAVGYSTWISNGFVALQRSPTRLEVTDIITGAVTSLAHNVFTPRVAKNGRAFMVVDATAYAIAPVAVAAFLYHEDGTLARKVPLPLSGSNFYDVQRAGDGFVVATAGDSGVHLFRFDASGTIASDQLLQESLGVLQSRMQVSVAVTPDRTVVAWTKSGTLVPVGFVSSVSASGQITAPEALPSNGPAYRYEGARVLAVAGGYVVLWNAEAPGGEVTRACRLDTAGHVIEGTVTTLSNDQFVAAGSSGESIAIVTTPWPYVDLSISVVPVVAGGDLRTRGTARLTIPVAQSQVQLASDGDDFLAIWVEHEGSFYPYTTRLARVTRSGEPLDGDGMKLPLPGDPPVSLTITRGAPGEALIVDATYSGIYALRWSRSAGLLDAAPIRLRTTGGDNGVFVAWNGARYLVVSRGNVSTLTGTFVGRDGSVSAPVELPIGRPPGAIDGSPVAAALAWDGHQFLLAVGIARFVPCQNICTERIEEIRLVRLSAEGAVVGPPVAVPGTHSVARLASSGSNFLLALDDGTFRIVTSGPNNIDVGPEQRFFTGLGGVASDVVWDGSAYVIVWRVSTPYPGPAWLRRMRVDTAGNMSVPENVNASPGGGSAPSAAVNDSGETAVALSEGTPSTATTRARIYLAGEFSVAPTPRRPRSVRH